jgi:hypothetical protein
VGFNRGLRVHLKLWGLYCRVNYDIELSPHRRIVDGWDWAGGGSTSDIKCCAPRSCDHKVGQEFLQPCHHRFLLLSTHVLRVFCRFSKLECSPRSLKHLGGVVNINNGFCKFQFENMTWVNFGFGCCLHRCWL